jgi:hypothetical protein
MNHALRAKPSRLYDHKFPVMDGRVVEVHHDGASFGAWLSLDETRSGNFDKNLSLQTGKLLGFPQTYVGYRDGTTNADTLAIIVSQGEVTVQVVLPSVKGASERVVTMTLAQLVSIIDQSPPLPQ